MDDIQNEGLEHNWVEAPIQLLDLIFSKLGPTKDGLQFGVVSEAWHDVLKENQRRLQNIHHQNQIPMLLMPENSEAGTWRAYDVTTDKYLVSKPFVSRNKRFCGSSRGWLAEVNTDWSITLRNPFSNDVSSVHLPPIFPLDLEDERIELHYRSEMAEYHDYHVYKVLITADPVENPDKCFIVVIFFDMWEIAFVKVAQSSCSWTIISRSTLTEDIMHFGSQLYSINYHNEVHSFDLEDPHNSRLKLVVPSGDYSKTCSTRYIVESHDKKRVYVIMRYYEFDCDTHIKTVSKIKIYKLNRDAGTLKRVRSIKDNVMFLGENSSICLKVSKFSECQQDCIYFTHDLDNLNGYNGKVSDLGMYHVPTKKFRYHRVLNADAVRHINRTRPIWVVPTFNT